MGRCSREVLNVAVGVRVRVGMSMSMCVTIAMIMLVEESGADQIESQTDASYDEHQPRIFDMLEGDEALDGLECNAQAQSEKEGAIKEGAEQLCSCPAKGQVLW